MYQLQYSIKLLRLIQPKLQQYIDDLQYIESQSPQPGAQSSFLIGQKQLIEKVLAKLLEVKRFPIQVLLLELFVPSILFPNVFPHKRIH